MLPHAVAQVMPSFSDLVSRQKDCFIIVSFIPHPLKYPQ